MQYLVVLVNLLCVTLAYKVFQQHIPNGETVPHPCPQDHTWQGVGHKNDGGGGDVNPFGRDFRINGFVWDNTLCKMDSDRDGKTNGEELGDPNCEWVVGNLPVMESLSHPGICEPLDDDKCQEYNAWEVCKKKISQCPVTTSPDVKKLSVRLAKTSVPVTKTSFYCQAISFPDDKDYHLVGYTPDIDHLDLVHHISLYGCHDNERTDQLMEYYKSPRLCALGEPHECYIHIFGYTYGQDGICYGTVPAGIRIGKTAVKKAILQVHFNNPTAMRGHSDSSGFQLYYTPRLRPADLGTLKVSQETMVIPPGKARFPQYATCSTGCTRSLLNSSINIFSIRLHMHHLGRKGYVEHYRNGMRIATLVSEDNFLYDYPTERVYDPPITLEPGDELRLQCVFNSTSENAPVYFGGETSDEMCIAYMDYYPYMSSFSHCGSLGKFNTCGYPRNATSVVEN